MNDFFSALGFEDTGGLVIWSKPGIAMRFDTLEGVEQHVARLSATSDVYFCLTPQLELLSGSRGTEDRATALLCVWADIDCSGGVHKAGNLPTRKEANDFLAAMQLKPSAVVWSGGGYHAYWFLREPFRIQDEEDRARAKALSAQWQNYVRRGLGRDLDNTSDLVRVLRVPGTINHKEGRDVPVKLGSFHPARRYNPSDFEDYFVSSEPTKRGLGETIRIAPDKVKEGQKWKIGAKEGSGRDNYLTSEAGALRRRGHAEGTIAAILSTLNSLVCDPPVEQKDVERIAKSMARHAPEEVRAPGTPVIKIGTDLERVNDEAIEAIAASGRPIYTKAATVVRVHKSEGITPVSAVELQSILSAVAEWQQYDPKTKTYTPTIPPDRVGRFIFELGGDGLVELSGIIECPTLRRDGSVLQRPGYDRETRLILKWTENPGYIVPDEPTKADALRSVEKLKEAICDFPFSSENDRSVFFAALLTVIGRESVAGNVPLFSFTAPTPGTGKSLLTDIIALITTGRQSEKDVTPTSPEEWQKTTLAKAIAAPTMIVLDNHVGVLDSSVLSSMLTAGVVSGRLLGETKTVSVPVRSVYVVTGNNISFAGDLARRVVGMEINSQEERPETRTAFRHPQLKKWVLDNRNDLIAAALTMLRGYHVAGRPAHGGPRIGSFEEWDDMIRGCVIWCGLRDPEGTRLRLLDGGDADYENLGTVIRAASEWFGAVRFTSAELFRKVREHQGTDIEQAFCELTGTHNGTLDAQAVGNLLRYRKGRPVRGMRIERAGATTGYVRWQVVGGLQLSQNQPRQENLLDGLDGQEFGLDAEPNEEPRRRTSEA